METHGHRTNLLYLFPPTLKLHGATIEKLEEGRNFQFRSREQVDANGIVWFSHTLRSRVYVIP